MFLSSPERFDDAVQDLLRHEISEIGRAQLEEKNHQEEEIREIRGQGSHRMGIIIRLGSYTSLCVDNTFYISYKYFLIYISLYYNEKLIFTYLNLIISLYLNNKLVYIFLIITA